ncbi:Rid family hydrolase [Actinoplanes sp. NPDC051346]|uniref:RidA family protein n=1 Tax=Actinoplanes sp. NPDC051346 TaxID=3155048 RepID=UPI0034247CCF
MRRTAINPWPWTQKFGFNSAEVVDEPTRLLMCAGQTSLDAEGEVLHPGDMAAQIGVCMDNVEALLRDADMTWENVVRLNMYTVDVPLFLENFGAMGERLAAANVAPPGSLLGVAALAFPELMVELEVTAAA